jgi:putative ABC transport system substrate-binding protein
VKRRTFIAGLGSAAAWPVMTRAQQPAMPVVGILHPGSSETEAWMDHAALRGLAEAGYVEGRNLLVARSYAAGQYGRLAPLAAELARRNVNVIVTTGGLNTALVAKAATTAIPIVFETGVNPVEAGLVSSLNRPGGNMTGITDLNLELTAKRLQMLRELVPSVALVAVLVNPANRATEGIVKQLEAAAPILGVHLLVVNVGARSDFELAFATLVDQKAGAILSTADPIFFNQLEQFITLASRHSMPVIYPFRQATKLGGLMSYGADVPDAMRLVGTYAGRILKGEKPADLPVQQSTKVELMINLKTAMTLGLMVPQALIVAANEIVE